MKNTELKKLANEFTDFLVESGDTDIEGVMGEFWFAKFSVTNKKRQEELLEFWVNN